MSVCRFCNQERRLIDAHIIPRSFFEFLYHPEDEAPLLMFSYKLKSARPKPVGSFDKNILCQECDAKIGKWDGYAKGIFIDSHPVPHPKFSDRLYTITRADPELIMLFFLSIIWRASISSQPEFRKISLGPFESEAHQMLISAKVTEPFEMVLLKYSEGSLGRVASRNIFVPIKLRIDGITFIKVFLPNAYQCYIKVDSRPLPYPFEAISLNHPPPISILNSGPYEDSKDFAALLKMIDLHKP
jgi:hypothetical protein